MARWRTGAARAIVLAFGRVVAVEECAGWLVDEFIDYGFGDGWVMCFRRVGA